MFVPIQELLPNAMQRFGVRTEVQAAVVCETYRKLAQNLVHPEVLEHTFPKSYRKNVLTIGVENPAWGQKITECKALLLENLQKELGKKNINGIRTQVVQEMPERTI